MIERIPITKLRPFAGHPYKVLDNDEMDALTESVREHGIMTPLIVRPMENGKYEIISGHRRLHAAKRAGIEAVPAFVHELDRDAAAIKLVDSNLHREHILPSEKAFAYKLKLEAINRQGQRSFSQLGKKINSYEEMAEQAGESRNQIHRYIRLTHLIPSLLDLVDEGRMAFSVGVELSYLPEAAQKHISELIERDEATPSYSQAVRMHKLSSGFGFYALDNYCIDEIMAEDKPNQRERVSLPVEQLRRFFPEDYSPRDMQKAIMRLVEDNFDTIRQTKPRDRGDR